MKPPAKTFLTFQGGVASSALELYREVFDDFEITAISRYDADGPGPEGSIMSAQFRLAGAEFMCADSPIGHAWGFTPAISIWIDYSNEAELDRVFGRLADGGNVYMPLGNYGFSARFGWVGDPFGVTWQLNVPEPPGSPRSESRVLV